jgi:hypothetical protein
MTGEVEEQIRVAIEHKKLLVEKSKRSQESESPGGKQFADKELKRVNEEINQLQDLLKQLEDQNKAAGEFAFEYPRRER